MRNLDIADSRAKLEMYASQPLDQGQVLVENGTLFGDLPAGGAMRIEANPSVEGDEEVALEAAAMEFGTTDRHDQGRRHRCHRVRRGEVLRLLLSHPEVEVGALTAASTAGSRFGSTAPPAPAGLLPLADPVAETTPETLAGHDVVFLALPHGASGAVAGSCPTTSS